MISSKKRLMSTKSWTN